MKKTFKCEYLQKPYYKKCQVTSCPANYQDYESGCILNTNKTITSKLLSSIFKEPIKEIDVKIAQIREDIQLLIIINKELEDFKYNLDYCHCGKLLSKCNQGTKCRKRIKRYKRFISTIKSNNIPLHLTPQEYYYIRRNKTVKDFLQ